MSTVLLSILGPVMHGRYCVKETVSPGAPPTHMKIMCGEGAAHAAQQWMLALGVQHCKNTVSLSDVSLNPLVSTDRKLR